MIYDTALEMRKFLKKIHNIKKIALEDEIKESDLPSLFEKFVKEENFIGRGGNSTAFRHEDKVLLIPNYIAKNLNRVKPENILDELKRRGEEQSEVLKDTSGMYTYRFRNLKSSGDWNKSLPIATWGGGSQGTTVNFMEYLGEAVADLSDQTPDGAKRNMGLILPIIRDDKKIEKTLDDLKEIVDMGYHLDPSSPDNITIGSSGEVNYIDLSPNEYGYIQTVDDVLMMMLPPNVFRYHPEKDSYKEDVRNFVKKIYSYGESIGIPSGKPIEYFFNRYGFANEEELSTLESIENEERLKRNKEEQERRNLEEQNRKLDDAKSLIESIRSTSEGSEKHDAYLYRDISFLSGKIPEDLYNLIIKYKDGDAEASSHILKILIDNPGLVNLISEEAYQNMRRKNMPEYEDVSVSNLPETITLDDDDDFFGGEIKEIGSNIPKEEDESSFDIPPADDFFFADDHIKNSDKCLNSLISLADNLDRLGFEKEANSIDNLIKGLTK